MSGRVVSDIQARAEGERLYIRYNMDTNACKRSYSSKILKILNDFGWENRTKSLCKSGGFSIMAALTSFVFPSWITVLMSITFTFSYSNLSSPRLAPLLFYSV